MVSTTHGPPGSGRPRLVLTERSRTELVAEGSEVFEEFPLPPDRIVTIGSARGADLELGGTGGVSARIGRDTWDEFVIVEDADGMVRLDGRPARGLTMHHGSRLTIGSWEFVFQRDEESDHQRPYEGRQGGEGSHQRRQPPRAPDPDAPVTSGPEPADEPGTLHAD